MRYPPEDLRGLERIEMECDVPAPVIMRALLSALLRFYCRHGRIPMPIDLTDRAKNSNYAENP